MRGGEVGGDDGFESVRADEVRSQNSENLPLTRGSATVKPKGNSSINQIGGKRELKKTRMRRE